MHDELDYYEARVRQEIEAAEASKVFEASIAHRRLAAEYETKARELREDQAALFKTTQ